MPGQRGPVPVPLKDANNRDLTQSILDQLDVTSTFTTNSQFPDVSQAEIKAALDRLGSRSMIEYGQDTVDNVVLEKEGESIAQDGSHEWKVWNAVSGKGRIGIKELATAVGAETAKFGQGTAMKEKWIRKDGVDLVPAQKDVQDKTRKLLVSIRESKTVADAKVLADLRKRKLVRLEKSINYTVKKGTKYAKVMPVEVTDLTADIVASGEWKTANFKAHNFNALGGNPGAGSNGPGALHPLYKVREEFRRIFFDQGFIEMPTNRYVDTGFWNFDALFVPQQHPARDMQDTFFISDPPKADRPRDDPIAEKAMYTMEEAARVLFASPDSRATKPRDYEKYWENVREVHERGAFGSTGYRYTYSDEESLRLVLRTHTTAVSTWALHRLAEDPRPAKYFSIDRVFRNETVDATHLAEFHQVEGVIADFGLTLGGLMKFLEVFFAKLGLTNLRYKPAYNPYTEPSMEIFGYHSGLGKWVEIGNSGVFRPEMLEPMGLPTNLRVYGFGLSLERPTMIRYGVSNIRELVGHKTDLKFVQEQPAVRFDQN